MPKPDDPIIGIRCQACGRPVQVRLSRINRMIGCSKCGASFSVNPARLLEAAKAAEQRFAAVWVSDGDARNVATESG